MGNAVWNAQLCMLQTVPQSPSDIDSAPVASVRQKSPPGYKVFASPATKHLAKENNINLAEVTGTGPEGRITRGKACQVVAQAMTIMPKAFARTCPNCYWPVDPTWCLTAPGPNLMMPTCCMHVSEFLPNIWCSTTLTSLCTETSSIPISMMVSISTTTANNEW